VNILYVCADRGIPLLGGKGASVHVRAVTSALQALGHRVTLAMRQLGSGNAAPAVHRIEQLAGAAEAAALQLEDLIVGERIDVVIERYSLQSGAARLATRRHGLGLTLEVNAPLAEEAARYRGLDDPGAQAWEHATLRDADGIHVVSSALLRYVRRVAPGVPATWVPNGCHAEAFRGAGVAAGSGLDGRGDRRPGGRTGGVLDDRLDGRLVVGFTGSMKPWHGVAGLLDAFARLPPPPGEPDPVLVLAGDGPQLEELRQRATAPDLRGRVLFTGALPHDAIPALVRRFDVGVAPYQPMETFYFHPLKVVEYLAAGLPVVYPDQGDLRELVGAAGLAYPPGAGDHLAERLGRLLGDHELRRDLARAAEARGAQFDWQRIARQVLDFATTGGGQ
jgi:glycosyltransferase involved in cell wall biosynthesis